MANFIEVIKKDGAKLWVLNTDNIEIIEAVDNDPDGEAIIRWKRFNGDLISSEVTDSYNNIVSRMPGLTPRKKG